MDINWEAIDAALRTKEIDPRCPACGSGSGRWDGGNSIIRLPVLAARPTNGKGLDPEQGPSVLSIMLSCSQCGYVCLFDLDGLLGED